MEAFLNPKTFQAAVAAAALATGVSQEECLANAVGAQPAAAAGPQAAGEAAQAAVAASEVPPVAPAEPSAAADLPAGAVAFSEPGRPGGG